MITKFGLYNESLKDKLKGKSEEEIIYKIKLKINDILLKLSNQYTSTKMKYFGSLLEFELIHEFSNIYYSNIQNNIDIKNYINNWLFNNIMGINKRKIKLFWKGYNEINSRY
jgi:hypothetical protein